MKLFLGPFLFIFLLTIDDAQAYQQPATPPVASPPVQTPSPVRKPAEVRKARPTLGPEQIQEARETLNRLGYWLIPDAKGVDASFRHALTAFQKVEGLSRTGWLNHRTLEALRTASPPIPQDSSTPHIEVDLDRQVLFIVDVGAPGIRVLPVSSGSGEVYEDEGVTKQATTPTGNFKVQRKIEGWRKSTLGLLYYPNYIVGGVAIHGNPAVPPRPASHGCIRIPMYAAKDFSNLAVVGTPVNVY